MQHFIIYILFLLYLYNTGSGARAAALNENETFGGTKRAPDVSVNTLNSHKILLDLQTGLSPNRFQSPPDVPGRKTSSQHQAMSTCTNCDKLMRSAVKSEGLL